MHKIIKETDIKKKKNPNKTHHLSQPNKYSAIRHTINVNDLQFFRSFQF